MLDEISDAMWAGDTAKLYEIAPCRCCCAEHTSHNCSARTWGGCRSGLGLGEGGPYDDERGWVAHYRDAHGLTEEEFYR